MPRALTREAEMYCLETRLLCDASRLHQNGAQRVPHHQARRQRTAKLAFRICAPSELGGLRRSAHRTHRPADLAAVARKRATMMSVLGAPALRHELCLLHGSQTALRVLMLAQELQPAPRSARWMRDDGIRPIILLCVARLVPAINVRHCWIVSLWINIQRCYHSQRYTAARNFLIEPDGKRALPTKCQSSC